jgi:HlyD family secretion protein
LRQYVLMQLLFVVTAVLQVGGIASIAPFVALVTNPALIHTNVVARYVFDSYSFASDVAFLEFFAVVLVVVIIVSNSIAAISSWQVFLFAQNLLVEMQDAVYSSFVRKDFVYYSSSNSARMIAVLSGEVPRYVYNVVQPFLLLAAQILVTIVILSGLMYLDAALSLAAFVVVGGAYLLVFGVLKRKMVAEGENVWAILNKKIKLLNESLGGIKEIRLLSKEAAYEKEFHDNSTSGARSAAFIGLAGDLPKFIIETITFCGLMLMSVKLLRDSGASVRVISTISLYAVAGYKLLPAVQQIYKSVSQIKANGSSLTGFIDDVLDGRAHSRAGNVESAPLPLGDSVRLENVSYSYPGATERALHDVSLEVEFHTIVSLVGRSGAGKSTLAEVLLGMLTPAGGSIRSSGIEITKANVRAWQRHLGYVPQNIFIIDDTVQANIAFGETSSIVDVARVRKAASLANIDTFVESLPGQYQFRVGERGALLSGGQRQRIGIARALYHNADILVLDEATSALDSVTERDILETLRTLRASKTIIMIAHRLSTVKHSDQVVFLDRGSIAAVGTFAQLVESNKAFAELVRSDLVVGTASDDAN